MNPYLSVAGLVCFVGLMLMLPLVPAFEELRRKSDAMPLSVIQQHAGDIRHFANSFRAYIQALEPTLRVCLAAGSTSTGTLPDGTGYLILGRTSEPLELPLEPEGAVFPRILVAATDLNLPPQRVFSNDIYAGGQFVGGENNSYRAILGEKDVRLGQSSRVLRWVHAAGEFTADDRCQLFGRISSDRGIRLHEGCSFLRLNAPCIAMGVGETEKQALAHAGTPETNPAITKRTLHDGDFEVPAGEIMHGNLVVRGRLRIHSGARICGSVKSGKDMVIEAGVSVQGSLICGNRMHIGPCCSIHGPVIAERKMVIEADTRCGSPEKPTSVSAPDIEVAEGVMVFGTLWARERGQVGIGA